MSSTGSISNPSGTLSSGRTGKPGGRSKPRDIRLDFFRGMAMLIIVIAHIPGNPWNDWIPARFGFSSAAEMFVFCSGFASALAFGSVFVQRSFGMGLARIAQRIWQLYWAQVAVFMFTVVLSVWATRTLGTGDYIASLYLEWFIEKPAEALPALMTLRYIPNFFDMLPMYMVLLALVPVVILIARISPLLVFACSISLWLFVQVTTFNLPARPNSDLVWFFNPLAWQMLFFTGFSFAMGWLKPPPLNDRRLVPIAIAVVVACVPLSFWGFHMLIPTLGVLHDRILPDSIPTDLHIVRLIHFFAVAYLALGLVARWQEKIAASRLLRPVIRVGQQTFAVFLVSVPLAWSMGMVLDVFGRTPLVLTLANLGGIATALGIAWAVAWFKGQPWRKPLVDKPGHDKAANDTLSSTRPLLDRSDGDEPAPSRGPVPVIASV